MQVLIQGITEFGYLFLNAFIINLGWNFGDFFLLDWWLRAVYTDRVSLLENRNHEMWKTGMWMKKFGIVDHWVKGPVLCAVLSAVLAGIGLLLKVMPSIQYKSAARKSMPAWTLKFMGQTEQGMKTMLSLIPDNISPESIRAAWETGLNLYRMRLPARENAKVACWHDEKEGHMKKAIEKLRGVYPRLTVRCFAGYGHGDIMNHPERLVRELACFMNQ